MAALMLKVPVKQTTKLNSAYMVSTGLIIRSSLHSVEYGKLPIYLPIAMDSRNYERMNSILAESIGKPLPSFKKNYVGWG